MNTQPARVLLVDDEAHLATALKLNLELDGYQVDVATSGRDAGRQLLAVLSYDLIILDVMLPDIDGFALCRKIRSADNFVPIIMLTARSGADDRVLGLDAGADDYLPKPFELQELLARVRSALRRRRWETARHEDPGHSARICFDHIVIDFGSHQAWVAEQEIRLTNLEFDLIRYFVQNTGRVLSREELLDKVWQLPNDPQTRTVDNFVMRLRRHLELDPSQPKYFHAVRGRGYRFVLPATP